MEDSKAADQLPDPHYPDPPATDNQPLPRMGRTPIYLQRTQSAHPAHTALFHYTTHIPSSPVLSLKDKKNTKINVAAVLDIDHDKCFLTTTMEMIVMTIRRKRRGRNRNHD